MHNFYTTGLDGGTYKIREDHLGDANPRGNGKESPIVKSRMTLRERERGVTPW